MKPADLKICLETYFFLTCASVIKSNELREWWSIESDIQHVCYPIEDVFSCNCAAAALIQPPRRARSRLQPYLIGYTSWATANQHWRLLTLDSGRSIELINALQCSDIQLNTTFMQAAEGQADVKPRYQ